MKNSFSETSNRMFVEEEIGTFCGRFEIGGRLVLQHRGELAPGVSFAS